MIATTSSLSSSYFVHSTITPELAQSLCRPLPKVAGDIRLEVTVRRAAARVPRRAGKRSGVGMGASRTRGLGVGRAVVGHVVIS